MTKKITLNGREVCYNLERKRVKNINLRIKTGGSIYVSASNRVSEKVIEAFLLSKADYILKALDYFAERAKHAPEPKQYVDGEVFKILGQDRILKVIADEKNLAQSDDGYIILRVKDVSDAELKKKTTDKWRRDYCIEVITAVCEGVYPKFQKYGIDFPKLRFRNMVSRWGSCMPNKCALTFNTALIEVPLPCIEYVVVHEFTHFLQPNHSKKFYEQMAEFMPDWRERKLLLEKCGSVNQ